MIGWASVIHDLFQDVSNTISAEPVPSSFYDLRAGKKGDVTVMFVVLNQGRKTISILAMTLFMWI